MNHSQPHVHRDEADRGDDTLPTREQFAVAMTRALSNTLDLARLCLTPRCRRSGRCKGNPAECLAVGEALLSPDIIEGAKVFLNGQLEGLSFDAVRASAPEQIDAFAQWSGRIAPGRSGAKHESGNRQQC